MLLPKVVATVGLAAAITNLRRPKPILLLEDNPDDAFFFQRALRHRGNHELHVAKDGASGMAYLCGLGRYGDRTQYPLPALLVTDLKMPDMSGLEFIKWVKDHQDASGIPIAVLTSSSLEQDRETALELGAVHYLQKPADQGGYTSLLDTLLSAMS